MWFLKRKVLVGLVLLTMTALCAVALVSARIRHQSATHIGRAEADKHRIEPVAITLRPTGFEPTELIRPRGLFLLVVNNRSNNPDIELRLDHESGERQYQERVRGGKLDWRKPLDLRPGRYLLREMNHPQWMCYITVTNN